MLRARAAAPCRAWATAAEASPRCERGGVKGHRGTRALKAPPSRLPPQPPPPFGGHVSPLADTFMHPLGQGLYDPAFDTDSCGVGILGELSKIPTRQCVTDGMEMLKRMQVLTAHVEQHTEIFWGSRWRRAAPWRDAGRSPARGGLTVPRTPVRAPWRARQTAPPPASRRMPCLGLTGYCTGQWQGHARLDPKSHYSPPARLGVRPR